MMRIYQKMNKKDYKAIAEIINKSRFENEQENPFDRKQKLAIEGTIEIISEKLADYFEGEWKTTCMERYGDHNITTDKAYFNREQFLKEAGVE